MADQLVVREAADRHEGIVAVGDAAVQVRGGNQALIAGKGSFVLSDGQIHAHLGRSLQDEMRENHQRKLICSRALSG
ncbi:hypothetical protein LD001_24600 [Pseudomonas kurunegalensis]|uniref:hypothetical protein n=1 Tax=Pseudomonas kurunegalensis TaxID=485880 RepID=UPI001CDD32FF|nr:hypothetical protein [Pseudomonas kurunegalensis]MCA4078446.1 hypothetical protein [Pseudomonas kurunegalensis]